VTGTPPFNQMAEITVLMPVYNGEKTLKVAIESILSQSYQNFEFLIINDGSTDDTETILKSLTDPRIIVIKNRQNLGIIKTLNNSLELIKTKYIARFDCDDVSDNSRLKKQLNFLENHPSVDIVGCQLNYVDQRGEYIGKTSFKLDHKSIKCSALFGSPIAHPGVMFKTSKFDLYNLRYNKAYEQAEDYELWQRALELLEFSNIDEPLVNYQISEKALSLEALQINNSKRIKRHYLSKLGVILNDSLLDIFIDFGNRNYNDELLNNFNEILHLIQLILEGNRKHNLYFDEGRLCQEFSGRLDEIVCLHNTKNRCLLDVYKKSSLATYSKLGYFLRKKIKLKQFLKR
jgi:glycosyltransferase involved in cell wall biosynthesis